MSSARERYLKAAKKKKEIKRQDSGSTLEGHKLAHYTQPSGPTDRGVYKGTAIDMSKKNCPEPTTPPPDNLRKNWAAAWDPNECAYYYYNEVTQETTWKPPLKPKSKSKPKSKPKPKQPSIKQQKPTDQFYDDHEKPKISATYSPDIGKQAKEIDRLKDATDEKLAPKPLKKKDRQITLPSPPIDKAPTLSTKETPAQRKKRRAALTKTLGSEALKITDEQRRKEYREKGKKIQQEKTRHYAELKLAQEHFYSFIQKAFKAQYQILDEYHRVKESGSVAKGTHWVHIKFMDISEKTAREILKNQDKNAHTIESLNDKYFRKLGDGGKKYYYTLTNWHTKYKEAARIKISEANKKSIKQQHQGWQKPTNVRPPQTPRGPPRKQRNVAPPQTPRGKPPGPVGENKIVPKKVKDKYRMARGADWIISQKNDETPILKIKSTGYTELYYQKDLPDNIEWVEGINPIQFDADTLQGIPITTNPAPKGKFSSVPGFETIDKYFFNIGNSKCFEYDDDVKGKALKAKYMRQNIRLEMRAGHVTGDIWRSNAGDSSIWTQYLNGKTMTGRQKKDTIWDDSVLAKIDHSDNVKDKEKLLLKTINKIKHDEYKNFMIFSGTKPLTDGFLDLDKKVVMGNGWYMFEFINNLDEMHLRDERYKGPKAKKRTPIVFFIRVIDHQPPIVKKEKVVVGKEERDETNTEYNERKTKVIKEWGKKRKILCEWEYRMEIIDELKKNDRMLTDIEKLVDFNTTERYCSSPNMRYREYTNICSHDALSAKRKWQEESKDLLKKIEFGEFETFNTTIQSIFKGLGMASIIKPILDKGPAHQAAIVTEIEEQINHIDILKFRMGKPNAAALPMPIKELKNIEQKVVQDVRLRILEFFDINQQEFNLLSEMQCTETDNCCEKTIAQLNTITNFIASKTDEFNKLVHELIEYTEHLGPILIMTTISVEDKNTVKEIIQDLIDTKTVFTNQWNKLIDSKKMVNTIIKLIQDKTQHIVKFGKQEAEDLTWVDTAKGPVSKKFQEMETRQNKWLNHIGCIKTLQENLQKFNNEKLDNDKDISDIILKFKTDIDEISTSFAVVLSGYKEQHAVELDRIAEEIEAAKKAAEEARIAAQKAAEEAEKKRLEELARIAKEKADEEERKRLEAEKKRLAADLDKALVKMIATWKEKLKEKELKDAEDTYRKELVIMYNEAIANNLKIKDEIETILEKLKGKEEKLKGEEEKSGSNELEKFLLAENANLTVIIKTHKVGLKNHLQTTINKLKNISIESKKIIKEYETNKLITHSGDIQQFINDVDKKINNLQIWSDTVNTDFFSESMELFNKEGDFKDENEYRGNIKNSLNDNIDKINTELETLPLLVKGPITVLKDKLNTHLIELKDKTHTNTVNVKNTLDEIEEKLKTQFDEYKVTCLVFQDDYDTLISLYEKVDDILDRKVQQETDRAILGENEGEKYEKMKKLQQKVDELDKQYKEKMDQIDKIILVDQFPTTTFFHKINEKKNENFYTDLITQIEAIDLSDIEEEVRKNYEDKQKELKIKTESHNTEFQLYRSIVLGEEGDGLGYKEKEEDLKIQESTQYDTLLAKLKGDDKSNDLCMKDLMKIKLLEWKTKAILKQDGHQHELMEREINTLKVAAEREAQIKAEEEEKERKRIEDERIENERLAAVATARALEETKLKDLQDKNSNILTQMNELKEKIKANQELIEQRKKAENERIRLNNLRLQKILRHASPNLRKDLDTGNLQKWLNENPGKTREDYKTEYLSKRVNTWG